MNDSRFPENDPAAFWAAAETGLYDSIELDLRFDKHGEPVIYHDREVDGLGEVREYSAEEIQEYIDSEDETAPELYGENGIGTLKEIIASTSVDEIRLEIKDPEPEEDISPEKYSESYQEIMESVEKENLKENTVIHSFNPETLGEFAEEGYDISLAIHEIEDGLEMAKRLDEDHDLKYISPGYSEELTEDDVQKLEQIGEKTEAWGVDSREELEHAEELGFDMLGIEHYKILDESELAKIAD